MAAKQDTAPDKGTDWEAMRPEWVAGIVSVSELERRYKVSRAAIRKHWAKQGVTRNLSEQIADAAATIVQHAEAVGADAVPPAATPAHVGTPTETETLAINARVQAAAIIRQRRAIARGQKVVEQLLTELEAQTFHAEAFERMEKLLRAAAKDGKPGAQLQALKELQGAFNRTASYTGRVENAKRLAETMKVVTELERRVLGIADDTPIDAGERVKQAEDTGLSKLRERFKARGAKVA